MNVFAVIQCSDIPAITANQPTGHLFEAVDQTGSIQDQGWYELHRQLEYKQVRRGGQVLAINPVSNMPVAVIQPKKIGSHKVSSSAWYVDIPQTLISMALVIF